MILRYQSFIIKMINSMIFQVIFMFQLNKKRHITTRRTQKKNISNTIHMSEFSQLKKKENTNLRKSIFFWYHLMIHKQEIITYIMMEKIIKMNKTAVNTIK